MQKKYGKACRKMKQKAWRHYVDSTPNESKMAILDKILQRKASQSIYTLKREDGSYTRPGKETINLLMSTCLLYTSPSPRDGLLSRMPSSA